ncbi:MAG: uncharacterized protein KVP18_003284 [Porospora cf. gigantea A]|nr:MAG: hypothetical protein KVP18_003284 [Porospora cf. gigantea A]
MRLPLKVVAASGPLGEDPGAPRELEIEWFSEISSGPPSERGHVDAVVDPEVEAEYFTVDISFPPLFRSLLPNTWPAVEPQPDFRPVPTVEPAPISRPVPAVEPAPISRHVPTVEPAPISRSVPVVVNHRPVLAVEPALRYGVPLVEPAPSRVGLARSAVPAQHIKRRKQDQTWNQHPSDFLVNLVDVAPDLVDRSQINVVLDLDQTLLHTIRLKDLVPGSQLDLSAFWDSKGQPDLELVYLSHDLDPTQFPYNYSVINNETVIFDTRATRTAGGSDNYFIVKLRPFLREFLEQLYQRCNLYVVTNGQKNYGETAVAILDPDHRFFGEPPRLICRSSTDKSQDKTPLLQQLLPGADPHNTLLVDDRLDVYDKVWWPSLLPVVAYNSLRCLVSSIAHHGSTSHFHETDCQLLATAWVIRSVVRAFYGGQPVNAFLANARRAVKIPRTALVVSNDQPPNSLNLRYSLQRHMWLQAQLRLYTGDEPECFDLKEVLRRGATSKCMVFANHGVIPASSLGAFAGTIFSGQWLDIVFSCLQMVEPLTFDVVRALWEESGTAVRFSWRATKQK